MASALNDTTREFGTALAETVREGVANVVAAPDGGGPQAQALVRAAQDSFVDGWQHAMGAGAAVMAVLFVYVLFRGPKPTALVDDELESDSPAPAVTG